MFLRQSAACGERHRRARSPRLLEAAEAEDERPSPRACADDRRHLAAIRTARESSAADYFARHAAEWDTLR